MAKNLSTGLTRRDLLAGGALLAAGGCRVSGAAPIEGGFVGAGHHLGHLLREPGRLPPPVSRERVDVAIVGGGVAGLAAAWHLARGGVRDLVLVDLEDAPGGNARSGASAATGYPWGAHYLPLPGPVARGVRALLRELGVIEAFDGAGRPRYDERHLCHAPQERLFIHGRWHEGVFPWSGATAEDRAQHAAFQQEMERSRRWRDAAGRRAFATPRVAGAPGAFRELDRLSMAELLAARGFTSPRLRWWVEYACRDDYGTDLASTSAWAGVHYYAARDPDPEYGDVVLTWPEGNGWLTRRLAEPVAERLRLGRLVVNVEPAGDRLAVDAYDPRPGRTERLLAREVVLACPVFVAARLYRPWRERPPAFLRAFRYAPWLVANLHLDRRPDGAAGAAPAWDNVLYGGEGLGYVVATHQSLRTHEGPTVWTYYRSFPGLDPTAARRALLEASWRALRDDVVRDLARPHPGLAREVRRLDVMRYGHAMVRPEPGFVCGAALAAAGVALNGPVHLAHSDLSGLSLFEEAFEWGSRAAGRVLARLGR
ncbi:MAG TPA: FAD-dependent oxidoreductase [Methylomirabilota bacterium]|nr:FAD-dependent oxidoreductase [Methylomirabilota bacterium]